MGHQLSIKGGILSIKLGIISDKNFQKKVP